MNKHVPVYDHASYLNAIRLDKFRAKAPIARAILSKYEFDAIAFRGLSGALSAIPMAHALDKTLIAVRKKGEDNHSDNGVEGDRGARRYIIIDDTIFTGATVLAITRAIKKFAPQAECLGTLEWMSMHSKGKLTPPESNWCVFPTSICYDKFGERDYEQEEGD